MINNENKLVPIYRYDPELFFFTKVSKAQIVNGHLLKPEASTLVPPPLTNNINLIPVFNETENLWILKNPLDLKLKKIKITFCSADYDYSKRFSDQSIPYIFEIKRPDNIGDPAVIQIHNLLRSLKKLECYLNSFSAGLFFAQRIAYLNAQIDDLYRKHAAFKKASSCNFQQSQYFYFQEVNITHNIKKLIDTVIVALYLENHEAPDHDFECDGLGYLLDMKDSVTKKKIKDKIDFVYYQDLFSVINNLHNGYKHEILTEQLSNQFNLVPYLQLNKFQSTMKNKRRIKDLRHITCYEIDLRKLIYACNDFLDYVITGCRNPKSARFTKVEVVRFTWTK
ncbi:unknown [Sutterella sp. CAG:521]|nr:unknown [Sutterella sp. CAG:521]